MKKILLIFVLLIALAFGIGGYMAHQFFSYRSSGLVTVEIKPGTSLRSVSNLLAQHGVTADAIFFEGYVRYQKKAHLIKAGEYEFKEGISVDEVIAQMVEGRVKLYPFTVPEGFNLRDIGALVATRGMATPAEWSALASDPLILQEFKIEGLNLEGYLYPDTYLLPRVISARELILRMVKLFFAKITPEQIAMARDRGFSLHQWVTLASIIEKETGAAHERPLIARVFLNRMEKGMPLQTDPTVIYGIPHFNGNLTRADLARDTPYNTYTRPGLPPGPICSPGMASLLAVLNPTPADYLFFVAKGDGTHQFSVTLQEHNAAVRQYQLR